MLLEQTTATEKSLIAMVDRNFVIRKANLVLIPKSANNKMIRFNFSYIDICKQSNPKMQNANHLPHSILCNNEREIFARVN